MNYNLRFSTFVLIVVTLQITDCFKLFDKRVQDSNEVTVAEEEKLFFNKLIPLSVTKTRLGKQVILQCSAGGSPNPTIHWLFKGTRIPQGLTNRIDDDEAVFEASNAKVNRPTLGLGGTQSRLFIDCVTEEDLGEYTCVADTPTKRISTTTSLVSDLTTEGEDFVNSCMMKRMDIGNAARIYMWTIQRLEYEGADVQLFCRTDGAPAPLIRWFDRNDEEIPRHSPKTQSSQYKILENGDLLIKSINWNENMGSYRCVAENEDSRDEVATFLYPTFI